MKIVWCAKKINHLDNSGFPIISRSVAQRDRDNLPVQIDRKTLFCYT